MEKKISSSNTNFMYIGSTLMGFQFGFFARLTWFEYSWDVMEPVTYFATYAAVIAMYGYFAVCAAVSRGTLLLVDIRFYL